MINKRIVSLLLIFYMFANLAEVNGLSRIDTNLIVDSDPEDITISNNDSTGVNIYESRLYFLDNKTPMDLSYNEKVQPFIDNYLGINRALIERMQGLKKLYFPLFEQKLDKYNLPIEFKYLAIVESALNPKAKSPSGATGLWQFMYLTGKQYELQVNSYMDERQDPYKSTEAACKYFVKLYDMFGDWNLVLAAYNGGPGYLQRKINSVGSYDFWELHPYLRKETRNYIPTFIAMNYVMNFSKEHDIFPLKSSINTFIPDTLTINSQVNTATLAEILCVNKETIRYLNPAYKKDVFPKNSILILPDFSVVDFLNNEESNYLFISAVDKKEILIDEERVVYTVRKGDYLGRIAAENNIKIFELKKWNNLRSTELDIGQKLVLYLKKNPVSTLKDHKKQNQEYIVQKGDTLWGIAKKHKGLSVWKIKSFNNLEGDNLKPGTKIILPAI